MNRPLSARTPPHITGLDGHDDRVRASLGHLTSQPARGRSSRIRRLSTCSSSDKHNLGHSYYPHRIGTTIASAPAFAISTRNLWPNSAFRNGKQSVSHRGIAGRAQRDPGAVLNFQLFRDFEGGRMWGMLRSGEQCENMI